MPSRAQEQWQRELAGHGMSRERLYELHMAGDRPFTGEGMEGVTAQDIYEFFIAPRENLGRREFREELTRGYEGAMRGAGARFARQGRRLGLGGTGNVSRMQSTLGGVEGSRASAKLGKARQGYEDLLASDPNRYADITNVGQRVRDVHGRHATATGAASAGMGIGSAILGILSPLAGPYAAIPAGIAAGLAAGSGGIQLGTQLEGIKAEERAAQFNPGMVSARTRQYTAPQSQRQAFQPFGSSNTQALTSLYPAFQNVANQQDQPDPWAGGDYLYGDTGGRA